MYSGDFNDLYNSNKYIIDNNTFSNMPVKAFGKLIVERYSLGYIQLYFPDSYNAIYYRKYYNNPVSSPEFSNWENILIDYNSRNLITNGYIIFKNNLIIQWGEVSVDTNNTYGYGNLPINFQNEHFSITGNSCYVDQYVVTRPVSIEISNLSTVKVAINPAVSTGGIYIKYIAIGY